MPDSPPDWLDPIWRQGPKPRQGGDHRTRPYFPPSVINVPGSGQPDLAAVMNVRYRPANSAYAIGRRMYDLAQRGLHRLHDVIGMVGNERPPWVIRKEYGPRGALYRLREVQEMIKRNKRVQDEIQKRRIQESARQEAIKATQIRSRALARARLGSGRNSGGGLVADVIGRWVENVQEEARQRDEQLRNLPITGVPMGSIAARAVRDYRSADVLAATQPAAIPVGPVGTAKLLGPAAKSSKGRPYASSSALKKLGESSKSILARTVMGTSKSLPTKTATKTASQFRLGDLTSLLMRTPVRVRARAPVRAPLRMGARTNQLPASTLQAQLGLTPLNSTMVASQMATKGCDCEKPKKRTQERRERCSNPLISRKVEGNVVTIKRELKCLPSKPKLPSAPA